MPFVYNNKIFRLSRRGRWLQVAPGFGLMESEYRLIRAAASDSALSKTFSISRLIKYLVPALELIERKDEIPRQGRVPHFNTN